MLGCQTDITELFPVSSDSGWEERVSPVLTGNGENGRNVKPLALDDIRSVFGVFTFITACIKTTKSVKGGIVLSFLFLPELQRERGNRQLRLLL